MKRTIIIILTLLLALCGCGGYEIPEKEALTKEFESHPESATETESMLITESEIEEEHAQPLTAEDIIKTMTIEEKVGQLFLIRNPKDKKDGIRLITELHTGGIIFFGRDFKGSSPKEFSSLIADYASKAKIPLLTAVDEEGGTVCRVSLYRAFRNERFPSPAELYAIGGIDAILSDSKEKSSLLLGLGINLNLAPVADISTNENDFIYKRTLGLGAAETSEYIEKTVIAMKESGILSALKHFPGYGNNEDTHTGIAYDKRSLEQLRQNDLLPFAAGIDVGAPIVMISHNIVECLDTERPASLSPSSVALLRDELGFEGVIMTDDLSMDAISDFTDSGSAAVMAITAGCDLLCCSDAETQYYALLNAVKKGDISEERINESVLRILKMKLDYGFFRYG